MPPRSNRRNGAGRRQDSGPRTPLRQLQPELHRSRPALHLVRDSAARTSPGSRASTGVRSPSRSCSRLCNRTPLAVARRSASRCAAAFVAGPCLLPEWRRWHLAMDPASAVAPASAADTRAAPDTPASSTPSCGQARTPVPLPAGSAPPHELPVALLHTVPPCTCLRCPTETHFSQWRRTSFVTPWEHLMPLEPECGGGLLLLRHVTPLTRRDVVHFYSGAHSQGVFVSKHSTAIQK